MKKSLSMLFCSLFLISCAEKPENIQAAYISPTTFEGMNCSQLQAEAGRVDNALVRASAQQTKARGNDTAGVILLGLPVSTLSGGNIAPQIADLKGRKEVLESTQIRQNCIKVQVAP